MSYMNDTLKRLIGNTGSNNNMLTSFIPNKWVRFGLNTFGGNIPGMTGGLSNNGMASNRGMIENPIQDPNSYYDLINNIIGKNNNDSRNPIYGWDYMN